MAGDQMKACRALRPWVTAKAMGLPPGDLRVVMGPVFDTVETTVEHLPTGATAHASVQVGYLLLHERGWPFLAGIAEALRGCLEADRKRLAAAKAPR